MIKPIQLIASAIIILLLSALTEAFYSGLFFIITSFGFLFIIFFTLSSLRKNSTNNIDLASRENAHSQKMQALGQLSAAIAHDFNNILTAITGYSDLLLRRHKKEDSSYKDANHIKQSAARATNLVRQLLTFSKKSKIEPTHVEVNKTIKNLSSLLDQLMGSSTSISIECEEENMLVLVDITQFEQIIINLAVNARDSMNQCGKVKIKAALVKVNAEYDTIKYFTPSEKKSIEHGKYVQISISDTGTGIDKKILKKIFEPFFSTKDQSGTGLGLATVFQIVEKMGGYVFVETQKNKGTTFHIYLKQTEDVEANNSKTKNIEAIQESNNNTSILVVEDEDPIRLFSIMALKNAGYNVEDARSAEDAIALIKQQKKQYDIMLTDISLGDMKGSELAESVKVYLPNIQIIFTSGYDKEALSKSGINLPEATFLSKPYNLDELIEATTTILKTN